MLVSASGESWDFSRDMLVLSEQNDSYPQLSAAGCECGYGNTIQQEDGSLVTVYCYANGSMINATKPDKNGNRAAPHIGVLHWRLPASSLRTDDEATANRVCTAALNALCRGTEPNACSVCCGRHQHELRAASCSAADCEAYCAPGGGAAAAISRPLDGSHFLGYNVVNLQSGNFSTDRAYVSGTAALRPGTLRYPGGNLGDWWDWVSAAAPFASSLEASQKRLHCARVGA